jgi:hypothetical protein
MLLLGLFILTPLASQVQAGVAFGPDANGATIGTFGAATASSPSPVYQVDAQQVVSAAPVYCAMINPGSTAALYARISNGLGTYNSLVQNVSSISVVVTDMKAGTVGSPIAITPSSAVLNPLQGWTIDSEGYNLKIALSGSNFPTANTTYQVVASIISNGFTFTAVWNLQTGNQI